MKREFSPSFAALFFASTLLRTILSSRGASMSRCMFPLEPPEYTTRMSFPMSIKCQDRMYKKYYIKMYS